MKVKKVYLENFLNYEKEYVEFDDGLNVLVGHNAAGKTNLLESIYYSSIGKSARQHRDKELINWADKEKSARIRIFAEKKYSTHVVDVNIDKFGKKRITIDNIPIAKIGELMGVINVVYFSPSEMSLIKDSPDYRRRFMDISLCQQDKIYFYSMVKYNKLLAQRNKLLKDYANSPSLKDMSTLVTNQMSEVQEYIIKKRKAFIEGIEPSVKTIHTGITDGKEDISILYETEEIDFDDIKGSLIKVYEKSYEKDVRLGYTTSGAHRDDIKISISGIDVRKYGSQGQQRTAVLSLKLAEVRRFFDVTGEYPILLLDDVLSELDLGRQKALLEVIDGVQTFVTCTEFDENIKGKKSVYQVNNGTIKKI